MRSLDIKERQSILLNIAKEFHAICQRHGIPYYMIGGTMLGAVRHKGFIPWDDDMDFGVPRAYFDTLRKALRGELPPPYSLIEREYMGAPFAYLKVQNTRTMIDEGKSTYSGTYGINIDIAPLEECSSNMRQLRWYFIKLRWLNLAKRATFFDNENVPLIEKVKRSIARTLTNYDIDSWLLDVHTLSRQVSKTGNDAMVSLCGVYNEREVWTKKVMGDPKPYVFEDTTLYGVVDYDAFLGRMYGDYMQLPPENQRRIHSQKAYML